MSLPQIPIKTGKISIIIGRLFTKMLQDIGVLTKRNIVAFYLLSICWKRFRLSSKHKFNLYEKTPFSIPDITNKVTENRTSHIYFQSHTTEN